MKDESTSLDRLHDVVVPPDIPWWPPAPGWYVVLGILLVLLIRGAWHAWRQWQQDAWRRAALSELGQAQTTAAVAALLRRCGLVVASRQEIARLSGDGWIDWMAARSRTPVPAAVRQQLTAGVYGPADGDQLSDVRTFAATWIRQLSTEQGDF